MRVLKSLGRSKAATLALLLTGCAGESVCDSGCREEPDAAAAESYASATVAEAGSTVAPQGPGAADTGANTAHAEPTISVGTSMRPDTGATGSDTGAGATGSETGATALDAGPEGGIEDGDCTSRDVSAFVKATWIMPGASDEQPLLQYSVAEALVQDKVTGLEWQRDMPAESMLDEQALSYCAELDLGGRCDWRLPTRIEAVSLLDLSRVRPAYDPGAFPDADGALVVWSGSPERYFRLGADGSFHVRSATSAGPARVRCVREGNMSETSVASYEQFGEVVRDTGTGLVWTRETRALPFDDAKTFCASLQTDGGGFRVPGVKELQTLIDETRAEPPWIDLGAFSEFPPIVLGHVHFWSSTVEAAHPSSAWMVDFATATVEATGSTASFTMNTPLHVRCVR